MIVIKVFCTKLGASQMIVSALLALTLHKNKGAQLVFNELHFSKAWFSKPQTELCEWKFGQAFFCLFCSLLSPSLLCLMSPSTCLHVLPKLRWTKSWLLHAHDIISNAITTQSIKFVVLSAICHAKWMLQLVCMVLHCQCFPLMQWCNCAQNICCFFMLRPGHFCLSMFSMFLFQCIKKATHFNDLISQNLHFPQKCHFAGNLTCDWMGFDSDSNSSKTGLWVLRNVEPSQSVPSDNVLGFSVKLCLLCLIEDLPDYFHCTIHLFQTVLFHCSSDLADPWTNCAVQQLCACKTLQKQLIFCIGIEARWRQPCLGFCCILCVVCCC